LHDVGQATPRAGTVLTYGVIAEAG
jgi:hypothetical protein